MHTSETLYRSPYLVVFLLFFFYGAGMADAVGQGNTRGNENATGRDDKAARYEAGPAASKVALERKNLDGQYSIGLPKTFRVLTEAEIAQRVAAPVPPSAMYADLGGAEVVFTATKAFFDEADIEIMRSFYRANIRSYYTKVNFLSDELTRVGGRPAASFEFTSEVSTRSSVHSTGSAIRKYTYVVYALRKRRVMVGTFTCEQKLLPKYQPLARQIMGSLK
jgi:hypothetical protein